MPKPVLQAMVLADHIYQDRVTGKFVIAGTFTGIHRFLPKAVPTTMEGGSQPAMRLTGPVARAGTPYLYLALFEIHTAVDLALKFVRLADADVLMEAQLKVTSDDPVNVAEVAIELPPLPTKVAGTYSLDLLHEGEILGSWRLIVTSADALPDSGGGTQ